MHWYSLWYSVSILLSFAALVLVWLTHRNRPWSYRVLLSLGLLALIWSLVPQLKSFTALAERPSQILFLAAVVGFGFVAIVDSIDRRPPGHEVQTNGDGGPGKPANEIQS